jgi:hypothetical protein
MCAKFTCTDIVKSDFGRIFSMALRPLPVAHDAGGSESGGIASEASSRDWKVCKRRMMKNEISWYANYKRFEVR